MKIQLCTWILLLLLFLGNTLLAQVPDLILYNGKIFTSDTGQLFVQAIAIKTDRVQATGNNEEIRKLAGSSTRQIDLAGKTVIPGINDAHDHIGYSSGMSHFIHFREPMLQGPSLQQVLDSLKFAVTKVPAGKIIEAHLGLQLIEDPNARRDALDKVAPDHPVILKAPWGHGTILNSKALRLLNISDTQKDPVGGWYEREEGSNRITGLLQEYAEFSVTRTWQSKLPANALVQAFRSYGNEALAFGITSVQNMATSLELKETIAAIQSSRLPIRIRVIRLPGTYDKGRNFTNWTLSYAPAPFHRVSGMKWILDGTPLERGALMRTDYSDRQGWKGRLNMPADTIYRILNEGWKSNEQLLLHITGDSTPNIVLAGMMKIGNVAGWKQKRVRFEHADGLLPDQWPAARMLGIVAVVNPSHFSFADINHIRVGKARSATYQPLASLIKAGIPVAIGSDGPINPFLNIMFALIHPTNPSEAITREQAVIAYTLGSAYAEFQENEKGRLTRGMLADIAVLSQDIFTIPIPQLPGTVSVLTIVGGKIVYEK